MELLHKEETYRIIGICMEIHKILGKGFSEVVYKDALEYEFKTNEIDYEREKEFKILYKDVILGHNYYADFVVFGKIILEVKAIEKLIKSHQKQCLNYLAVSKLRVGLLVNFGEDSLKYERVVL